MEPSDYTQHMNEVAAQFAGEFRDQTEGVNFVDVSMPSPMPAAVFTTDEFGDTRVFLESAQSTLSMLEAMNDSINNETFGMGFEALPIERQHYYAGQRDAAVGFHTACKSIVLLRDLQGLQVPDSPSGL